MWTICKSFLQSSVATGELISDKQRKYPHGTDAAHRFFSTIDVKPVVSSMQMDREPGISVCCSLDGGFDVSKILDFSRFFQDKLQKATQELTLNVNTGKCWGNQFYFTLNIWFKPPETEWVSLALDANSYSC